ncbi:HPr family phosphocarrier protein [Burkholderia arboris]
MASRTLRGIAKRRSPDARNPAFRAAPVRRRPGAAPRSRPPVRRFSSIVATVMYVQIGPAWNRNRGRIARDATVDAARRFDSDIQLIANGHSSNAKDSGAIASLQVHGGTSAQVLATGPDEEAALQALLPLLQAS